MQWFAHNSLLILFTHCTLGDTTQVCGGGFRISVYKSSATPPPAPSALATYNGWGYQGCLVDAAASRSLGVGMGYTGALTPQKCLDACHGQGYQYAGMEYSTVWIFLFFISRSQIMVFRNVTVLIPSEQLASLPTMLAHATCLVLVTAEMTNTSAVVEIALPITNMEPLPSVNPAPLQLLLPLVPQHKLPLHLPILKPPPPLLQHQHPTRQ